MSAQVKQLFPADLRFAWHFQAMGEETEFVYLYVIDPDKNRIVLFDKINGSLIGQYISDKFNDLKNITVDEEEKKMYILNGDKIFEVEIEIID